MGIMRIELVVPAKTGNSSAAGPRFSKSPANARAAGSTGPVANSMPARNVTLASLKMPRCMVGSKKRIARVLRSMTRPGASGPTSLIFTTACLSPISTRANAGW
jgi:hypothetical protein